MNELLELMQMKNKSDRYQLIENMIFKPEFLMMVLSHGKRKSKQASDKFMRSVKKMVDTADDTGNPAEAMHAALMIVMMSQIDVVIEDGAKFIKKPEYQPEVG